MPNKACPKAKSFLVFELFFHWFVNYARGRAFRREISKIHRVRGSDSAYSILEEFCVYHGNSDRHKFKIESAIACTCARECPGSADRTRPFGGGRKTASDRHQANTSHTRRLRPEDKKNQFHNCATNVTLYGFLKLPVLGNLPRTNDSLFTSS